MSRNFLTEAYQKLRRRLQQESSHSGEDALNDAFCSLWAGRYSPSSVAEGEKLLSVAAHRRQISLWRTEKGRWHTPLTGTLRIADPHPDNDVEEMYQQIRALIEVQLTPLQQDILTRHDMNGETYQEIAHTLGMKEPAVRMQLSRARNTIRKTYKTANRK